jgi:hypothetical protein
MKERGEYASNSAVIYLNYARQNNVHKTTTPLRSLADSCSTRETTRGLLGPYYPFYLFASEDLGHALPDDTRRLGGINGGPNALFSVIVDDGSSLVVIAL